MKVSVRDACCLSFGGIVSFKRRDDELRLRLNLSIALGHPEWQHHGELENKPPHLGHS
jgi:hypothetical protein